MEHNKYVYNNIVNINVIRVEIFTYMRWFSMYINALNHCKSKAALDNVVFACKVFTSLGITYYLIIIGRHILYHNILAVLQFRL